MVYYLNENFLKDKPYITNKFLSHKLDDDHILITTDHGSWVVLSAQEYDMLLKNKVEEDLHLFDTLEEKGVIITRNNQSNISDSYTQRFDYLSNGITLHIIAPTLRCNHSCIYCQANSRPLEAKGYDMDEDTAKAVVDFIFQTPSKFITIEFQGGEPLANFPVIKYIIEYAKEKNKSSKRNLNGFYLGDKGLAFTIVSNLTMMDEDILNYILSNRIRINTSLDGPEELHNKNRPMRNGKGSYEELVHWLDILKKNDPRTSALPTITKYSLDYSKEIVNEYIKQGFNHTRMRELNIAGVAATKWEDMCYTAEEFIKFWHKYLEYVIGLNKKGVKFWDETTNYILTRILCKKPLFNACMNSPCGVGTIQCAYNHLGDVYTCDEARAEETFRLGNVKKDTYKKIFTSESVAAFVGLSSCLSFSCDECVWHPFCSPCLVSAYGETKSLVPRFPTFTCRIRGAQTQEIFKKIVLSEDKKILLDWMNIPRWMGTPK